MATYDMKEIANKYVDKQDTMVDELLEKSPILDSVRWEQASHNFWNVAEEVTDVTGAGFTNFNAPLQSMNVSTDLRRTDLAVLGGEMEVREDTARQFGGAEAYFRKKEPKLLKKAGMDTERKLYYDNWLAKAIDDGNVTDAGATSGGTYSIVAIRMEEGVNCGLYDPTNFDTGSLLKVEPINNYSRYYTRESGQTVLGYGVTLKGNFGWQNLSKRCVAAIVNIQKGHLPTALMLDDLLATIRADDGRSMLLMHRKCKNLALNPFKESHLETIVGQKEFNRSVESYDGIPVVTSYNLKDGTETAITGL